MVISVVHSFYAELFRHKYTRQVMLLRRIVFQKFKYFAQKMTHKFKFKNN